MRREKMKCNTKTEKIKSEFETTKELKYYSFELEFNEMFENFYLCAISNKRMSKESTIAYEDELKALCKIAKKHKLVMQICTNSENNNLEIHFY